MKLNLEEMFKDEVGSALDYYSWSIEYKDVAPIISIRFKEISYEELNHATFWLGLMERSGNDKIEEYREELEEARKVIFEITDEGCVQYEQ